MVKYLLGIDIGTTSSKGLIVDTDARVIISRAIPHGTESPKPGWYEQDADAIWWGEFCQLCRVMINDSGIDPRDIIGVGHSEICPEMLPVDEAGRPLRKGILYSDSRTQKQIEEVVELFQRIRPEQYSSRLRSTHYVGPKIMWFRENEPALYARTFKVHTATSYINFKLTGNHVCDYADAPGFSPLFDVANLKWDEEICRALDIPVSLLPDLAWTTEVVGGVTAQAARETGLAEGTPVIAGCCDGSSDRLSTGAYDTGEASITYGTTLGFGVGVSEDTMRRAGGLLLPGFSPNPETYRLGGATTCSGALTTWFRNNFGQAEMEAERKLGISAYWLLSEEAWDIPPGSEGLLVLPYFAGERATIQDALARGMIIGLTLSHTRRHLYRALMEAIAYGTRQMKEDAEQFGAQITRIVGTGGGTKARIWTQTLSDVMGMDQEIVINPLGSPYGDAFLAGVGVGLFNDFTPLHGQWAPPTRRVTFNPDAKRVYDQYYAVYCTLYEKNKDAMHRLAELASLR